MFLYAIGILPLIRSLKDPSKWTQVWYADDASACGELSNIRKWFDLLLHHGPLYGYFPNPSKCCVVVDLSCFDHAVQLFSSLGVQIVLGHRFLGGYLGTLLQGISLLAVKFNSGSLMFLICHSWLFLSLRVLLLH